MSQSGFWWILLIGAVFGVLHSLLASNRVKDLAARAFRVDLSPSLPPVLFTLVAGITTLAYFAAVLLFPDRALYRIQPRRGFTSP